MLSKETIANIPYSKMKYINELVENLESISIKVKAKRDNVSKGRRQLFGLFVIILYQILDSKIWLSQELNIRMILKS